MKMNKNEWMSKGKVNKNEKERMKEWMKMSEMKLKRNNEIMKGWKWMKKENEITKIRMN